MRITVRPGETRVIAQDTTFTGTGFIAGNAAGFGGTVEISAAATLTNDGMILVGHSPAVAPGVYGNHPGVLSVSQHSTLINNGTIALQGRAPSTYALRAGTGGVLNIYGQMDNTGLVVAGGAYGGNARAPGLPAYIGVTGTLTNHGTIVLQAARSSGYGGSYGGGALYSSGDVINDNTIIIQSGIGAGPDRAPGVMSIEGDCQNNGTIIADGVLNFSGEAFSTGFTNSATGLVELSNGIFSQSIINNQGIIRGGGDITNFGLLIDSGTIALGDPDTGVPATPDFMVESLYSFGTGELEMAGGTLSASVLLDASTSSFGHGTISGSIVAGSLPSGLPDPTVTATGGVLVLNASVGGNIALAAAAGATLVLNGTVAATDTLTLAGPTSAIVTSAANAGLAILSPQGGTLELPGGTLNAADTMLVAVLTAPGTLDLGTARFLTGIGSAGNDTLQAMGASQTLTGGSGIDTLIGAATDGDRFADTSTGLNGDLVVGFAGTDVIDITDLAPAGLSLGFVQTSGTGGVLTVSNGSAATDIRLSGSFSTASFTTAADGHGGVTIGLH